MGEATVDQSQVKADTIRYNYVKGNTFHPFLARFIFRRYRRLFLCLYYARLSWFAASHIIIPYIVRILGC